MQAMGILVSHVLLFFAAQLWCSKAELATLLTITAQNDTLIVYKKEQRKFDYKYTLTH